MKRRALIFIVALLAASALNGAYAKSYDLEFLTPIAAGNLQLPPGTYRLEFKDSTAILTNAASGKDYKVPVKVTNSPKKFKATSVESDSTVNPPQLRFIQLGGSTTRLEFGQ